jgi:hypothetical protein
MHPLLDYKHPVEREDPPSGYASSAERERILKQLHIGQRLREGARGKHIAFYGNL